MAAAGTYQRAPALTPPCYMLPFEDDERCLRSRESLFSQSTTFDGCMSSRCSSASSATLHGDARRPQQQSAARRSGESNLLSGDPWEGCSDIAAEDMAAWMAELRQGRRADEPFPGSGAAGRTVADRVLSTRHDVGSTSSLGLTQTVPLAALELGDDDLLADTAATENCAWRFHALTLGRGGGQAAVLSASPVVSAGRVPLADVEPVSDTPRPKSTSGTGFSALPSVSKLKEVEPLDAIDRLRPVAQISALDEEEPELPGFGVERGAVSAAGAPWAAAPPTLGRRI